MEDGLMSKLYGIDVVHSPHDDTIRVCVPANSL